MSDTFLQMYFSSETTAQEEASARTNAVFIYSKLCQAGMDRADAKQSVEQLFIDGFSEGSRYVLGKING